MTHLIRSDLLSTTYYLFQCVEDILEKDQHVGEQRSQMTLVETADRVITCNEDLRIHYYKI